MERDEEIGRGGSAAGGGLPAAATDPPRAPAFEAQRLGAAIVGLFLSIVPAISSFFAGGTVDFSVQSIVVAGALGLPLVLLGFSATREGPSVAAGFYLVGHRVLTAALLVAAVVFGVRGEGNASVLFALCVIVLALLLLTGTDRDVERQGAGATTVGTDPHRRTGS